MGMLGPPAAAAAQRRHDPPGAPGGRPARCARARACGGAGDQLDAPQRAQISRGAGFGRTSRARKKWRKTRPIARPRARACGGQQSARHGLQPVQGRPARLERRARARRRLSGPSSPPSNHACARQVAHLRGRGALGGARARYARWHAAAQRRQLRGACRAGAGGGSDGWSAHLAPPRARHGRPSAAGSPAPAARQMLGESAGEQVAALPQRPRRRGRLVLSGAARGSDGRLGRRGRPRARGRRPAGQQPELPPSGAASVCSPCSRGSGRWSIEMIASHRSAPSLTDARAIPFDQAGDQRRSRFGSAG